MLDKLDWDDDFSVEVKDMDEDHKVLFRLARSIAMVLQKRAGLPVEEEIFHEIINFTKYHFSKEEELMEEADYCDIQTHKNHHKKLIRQIEDFSRRIANEGYSVGAATDYLLKWLVKHIYSEDKKYTDHFHSRGLY